MISKRAARDLANSGSRWTLYAEGRNYVWGIPHAEDLGPEPLVEELDPEPQADDPGRQQPVEELDPKPPAEGQDRQSQVGELGR